MYCKNQSHTRVSSSPLKYTLCFSSDEISPKFFQRIRQSPSMFQRYPSILWVSSSSFPAGLRVLLLIFLTFATPVAYLSPKPQCPAVGAVIVNQGYDRSGIKYSLGLLSLIFLGQNSAWRSPLFFRLFMLTAAEFQANNMKITKWLIQRKIQ